MVETREKMKVILLYVTSLDGKVTKWGQKNIYWWTSAEDVKHFRETIDKVKVLVMGSKTYEAVHPKPTKGILRIVLTSKPEQYATDAIPGQLEFSSLKQEELIEHLEARHYNQMLLVSGRTVTTSFLKKNLVDELWLTIEPKIFGLGDPMVLEEKLDIQLKLQSMQSLNKKGTLLLKYTIEK